MFADDGAVRPVVAEELAATDDHADPYRRDAPWASVPCGVDPSEVDSSDAWGQLRDGFSKCAPRVAAAMPPGDADADPDPDHLTNEIETDGDP